MWFVSMPSVVLNKILLSFLYKQLQGTALFLSLSFSLSLSHSLSLSLCVVRLLQG